VQLNLRERVDACVKSRYVVQPAGMVRLQNVTVTNEANDKSAIEGLGTGTVVAASDFDRLQDGAKVMTMSYRAPTTGGRQPSTMAGASR
jgi:hypothetical protein